jgi:hypothetical protein
LYDQQPDQKQKTIFIATGTPEKFRDLRSILNNLKVRANIRPIYHLVDNYLSAPEDTGTYEGNTRQKKDAAVYAWNIMPREKQEQRLLELGIKREDILILAEDSGIIFHDNKLLEEPEFDCIGEHLRAQIKKSDPGVETVQILVACNGVVELFKKIASVQARRPVDDGITQVSHVIVVPLTHPLEELSGEKRSFGTIVNLPRPDHGAMQLDNFIIPQDIPRNSLTEAELGGNYRGFLSVKASVLKNITTALGLRGKKSRRTNSVQLLDDFTAGVITDQEPLEALDGISLPPGMRVVGLSANIQSLKDVETKLFDQSDSIILAFDPDPVARQTNFFRNLYIFTSALVAEQTHDKHVLGKKIILVNPDGAFDDFDKLVYDLNRLGAVPQDPAILYRSAESLGEALKLASDSRAGYSRLRAPLVSSWTKGAISLDRPSFAALLSATSENHGLGDDVVQLLEASRDLYDVFSGAGVKGGMGVITREAMRLGMRHYGSNVPHIMDRPFGEGHVENCVTFFELAQNIYQRIATIIGADALLLEPGGTGSIQETAAALWLKQAGLRNEKNEDAGLMVGKTTVIANPEIMHEGRTRGYYDVFLAMIPSEDFAKLDIKVATKIEETIALLHTAANAHAELRLGKPALQRLLPRSPRLENLAA